MENDYGNEETICVLSNLASEVKRATEDREGWRATNRRGMPCTCYYKTARRKRRV